MVHCTPERIVFTRHPECMHNVEHENAIRRGIANRESPLTEAGRLQRDITAEYLRREFPSIDAVFCSTYARTRTIPIAAGFEKLLVETSNLDERNMGVWHTHVREDVLKLYPGEEDRLKAVGYYAYEAPSGESCSAVELRLKELLAPDMLGSGTVYISAHGISGLCLRRVLTGASLVDWHSWDRLKNASVSVYDRAGSGYVSTSYNVVPWEGLIDPALLRIKTIEA